MRPLILATAASCYSASGRGAEYCDERVCVCLSVRDHIFGTTRPIFTRFFAHATYDCDSVLLWRRSDTLCTAGLCITSYLLISQAVTTFRALNVTSWAATPGAESAVYDWLVAPVCRCSVERERVCVMGSAHHHNNNNNNKQICIAP